MSKKLIFLLLILLLPIVGAFAQNQPSIVSQTPTARNVLLDNFTGELCHFCPLSHSILDNLMREFPRRIYPTAVFVQSSGTAGFDPPLFTKETDVLADEFGHPMSPSGIINRSTDYLDYEDWRSTVVKELSQTSPVNVAAKCSIDWNTRELVVDVEAFYTENGVGSTNRIGVLVVQNNMMGYQSAADEYHPAYLYGKEFPRYRHMHVLRHFIPSVFGDTIVNTQKGSLFAKTYRSKLPEFIEPSDGHQIPLLLEDLEFYVYVAQNNRRVETIDKATIVPINYPQDHCRILLKENAHSQSDIRKGGVLFTVLNSGKKPISSLDFDYSIPSSGITSSYHWSRRSIPTGEVDTVYLSGFDLPQTMSTLIKFKNTKINGTDVSSQMKEDSLVLKKQLSKTNGINTLKLVQDQDGENLSFAIFSPDGFKVLSGGPYETIEADTLTHHIRFTPPTTGCYKLEVYNRRGSGLEKGYFEMSDEKGKIVFSRKDSFTYLSTHYIQIDTCISLLPQKRNVVIEEETSRNCNHCPEGAKTMVGLLKKYPGRILPVAIYKEPMLEGNPDNLESPDGNQYLEKYPIEGSPGAYINRGKDEIDGVDDLWERAVDSLLNTTSPVNLAAYSVLDCKTRILTVDVTAYYTDHGVGNTNRLSIVLLQNNYKDGQQTDMYRNAEWIVGDDSPMYMHQHILRQYQPYLWGDTIVSVQKGSLFQKRYTIHVPQKIQEIPLLLQNIEVGVILSQGEKNTETAILSPVQFVNPIQDYGRILNVDNNHPSTTKESAAAIVWLSNEGFNPINYAEFEYRIEGQEKQKISWSARVIPPRGRDTIHISNLSLPVNKEKQITINWLQVNDQVNTNTEKDTTAYSLLKHYAEVNEYALLKIQEDNMGSQISFTLFDPDGKKILAGGPWKDVYEDPPFHTFDFRPATLGIHKLQMYDKGYNGICCRYGSGYINLSDAQNQVLFN